MSDFISTKAGKIVNVDAIAFITTRVPPPSEGAAKATKPGAQLVIGFSAATSTSGGSLMPLSLVIEGDEAKDFLQKLKKRGIEIKALLAKLG